MAETPKLPLPGKPTWRTGFRPQPEPWIRLWRVLQWLGADVVGAIVFLAIIQGAKYVLDHYLDVENMVWLKGKPFEFSAGDIFAWSDLGLILVFVLIGGMHFWKEMWNDLHHD